jgi:hypothetical protein
MRVAAASDSCRRKRNLVMTGKKIAHWFEYALFAAGIGLLMYVGIKYALAVPSPVYMERIFLADPPPAFKARVAIPTRQGSQIGTFKIPSPNVCATESAEGRTLRIVAHRVDAARFRRFEI